MIIKLRSGQHMATSMAEAKDVFTYGKFREATQDECVEALNSIPLTEISAQPQGYQHLACAIARISVYVGAVAKQKTAATTLTTVENAERDASPAKNENSEDALQ